MAVKSGCQGGRKERTITCAGTSFYCKGNTKVGQQHSRDHSTPCSWETWKDSPWRFPNSVFSRSHIPDRILQQKGKTSLSHCTREGQEAQQVWVPDPSQSLHYWGFLPSGILIYNSTQSFTWVSGRKVPSASNTRAQTCEETKQAPNTRSRCTYVLPGSTMPRALQSQPCSSSLTCARCSPSPTLCYT